MKTPGEPTRGKHDPWQPGESGNPAGRPKGSRNKLGEEFTQALYADFLANGPAVIEKVRAEKPDAYLKVIASILPKEFKVEHTGDELSDSELSKRIRQLADLLELGIAGIAGGGEAPEGAQSPRGLSSLQ